MNSSDYKREKNLQHWKQGEWSDYKQGKNLQSSRNVEWGQSSKELEWGQPSEKLDIEVFHLEEIPKPILDESEWSDGWK